MLDSIRRILALTRKELLAVLKDPRGRFSLFFPPIFQCLIFGYAATYDLYDIPYAVLDQDHSDASRALLARLDGSKIFRRVADLHRQADIGELIDNRTALVVLQFDQNFQRDLMAGLPANVQVIADGRNSNTAGTAIGYVGQIVDAFNADWQSSHAMPTPAVSVAVIPTWRLPWFNPDFETRWNMIPGLIGTLTMLQTLLLTAMSVAREREQGTFDQLLVTPYRPMEIMAGKAQSSILIGAVQATNILLVAQLWFKIPFNGSFVTLYIGLSLFLLAAVGIGLLVSAVCATMQQAMLFSFLVMMPFALLSGLTTPIGGMPQWLQYATGLNPLRYAIDIAQREYLEGTELVRLLPDFWPLAVMAVVSLSAASWMFRHRLT